MSHNPRRPTSSASASSQGGLSQWVTLGSLLLCLVVLLASESPDLTPQIRMILTQGGSLGLLVLLALCGSFAEDMRKALLRGLNPLILVFLLWSAFATLIAPYRTYAFVELLRVIDGIVVYFIAAYGMPRPQQPLFATLGLLGMGVALCLYDFSVIGQTGGFKGLHTNAFGTHENFGSLVMLLLPTTIAFAVSKHTDERLRIGALIGTPILGGGLLLSLTRSAWLGGSVALLCLAFLFLREGPRMESNRNASAKGKSQPTRSGFLASPVFLILIGFLVLISVGGVASTLTNRARTLVDVKEEGLLGDRLTKWKGGVRMASEKPLLGWGLGSSLVMQGRWTHQGDDIAEVLTKGTDHQNIAHNFYVQWAADSGGIGLALYCAIIISFLIMAFRALPTLRAYPASHILLIGCIATVLGASVDAVGAPSYNFHGVSSTLWFFMGIGVAVMRPPSLPSPSGTPPDNKAIPPFWLSTLVPLGAGIAVAALVVGIGFQIRQRGASLPQGKLEVIATPSGRQPAGTLVTWTAQFTDENGRPVPTMPGTVWTVQADQTVIAMADGGLQRMTVSKTFANSTFYMRMPPFNEPIRVEAKYWDAYGRVYTAEATVEAQTAPDGKAASDKATNGK